MTSTTLPFDLESVNVDEIEVDKKYDLGNGYYFLLKEEADDCYSINDDDFYGKVEWSRDGRPVGFDGSAKIISSDFRNDKLWWMPYREGKKVYNEPEIEKQVRKILEYGYSVLILTLYGHAQSIVGEHTVKIASSVVGGVEPDADLSVYVYDYLIPQLQENLIPQLQENLN